MVCLTRPCPLKFFKGCLPQNVLSPLLNTLSQISEELRRLTALPCKLDGMGIINTIKIRNKEYVNSRELTKKLTNLSI